MQFPQSFNSSRTNDVADRLPVHSLLYSFSIIEKLNPDDPQSPMMLPNTHQKEKWHSYLSRLGSHQSAMKAVAAITAPATATPTFRHSAELRSGRAPASAHTPDMPMPVFWQL